MTVKTEETTTVQLRQKAPRNTGVLLQCLHRFGNSQVFTLSSGREMVTQRLLEAYEGAF